MPLIAWNEKLAVNIKQIDDEHKHLVALINELHDAMVQGKGREVMGEVLTNLVEYTQTHFAHEEHWMSTYGYLGYVRHKNEHDALTKQVLDLQRQYLQGQAVLTMDVMNFLRDWLNDHIMGSDQKYAPYLRSKGVE